MQNDSVGGSVSGGSLSSGSSPVPKGKRFLADLIDLIAVPVVLGVIFGILLLVLHVPERINTILLIVVNVAWMMVRDLLWAPGRKLMGLKLVGIGGDKVLLWQALVRNLLLILPGVLVLGYPVEAITVFLVKGDRLMDGLAKTRVVMA